MQRVVRQRAEKGEIEEVALWLSIVARGGREQDRHRLRSALLDGASSPVGPIADDKYFASVREALRSSG